MTQLPESESKSQVRLYRREQRGPTPPTDGPAAVRVGQTFGDFRLVRYIDQGGMGQVWEAQQESLSRKVALKLVLPERVDSKSFELFAREARAGGRMHHANVVETYAHGHEGELAWIAQELVEGSWTLKDFLDELRNEGEVPVGYYRSVTELVAKLADALSAAHGAGVIHRDVKPPNVLITRDDEPKLTDFGLARIIDETALSQTGDFAGTYFYMSPEQVTAKRVGIDYRTDIFSLGVLLYEILTLRRPFEGDTSQQICAQIVFEDPVEARKVRSQCPRDLSVICGKAMEKAPKDRYATMAEFAADLRRQLAREPILARPPSVLDRGRKWVQRKPAKAAAVGITIVAFLVISGLGLRISKQKADLELTNTALDAKTTALQTSNESLALEKKAAEDAREEAQKNAEEAQSNAERADTNAREAERKASDVLRLSVSQDIDDLVLEAAELWPADPDKIRLLQEWVSRAETLTGEIPNLVRKRDELRLLAVPQTDEERVAERESHAEFGKLSPLRSEIASKRLALSVRRGTAEVELPALDWSEYPADANGLNSLAWPLVDPDREVFGEEALGLVLAQRAVDLAPEEERAGILDSVAWGCFGVGDDEGALTASGLALDSVTEEKREEYGGYLAKLESLVSAGSSAEGLAKAEAELLELESELTQLEHRVNERQSWVFPDGSESETKARWWHNQLTGLIGELDSLGAAGTGLLASDGVSLEHGWSVSRRLAFAEMLRTSFGEGGEFATRWESSLEGINDVYPGLGLAVQVGLVPISVDPDSGLWEFWDVQSGDEPLRGNDGKLVLEDGSGLVFVLLRGGSFFMGAQSKDPDGRNLDKDAVGYESPVHEVELSAFFLSKYELTQGQWLRLTGSNPSQYAPSSRILDYQHDLTHPVEQVSWFDCMTLLPRVGLGLPTEAQWEYGARGGTDTVWWTGNDRESLREQGAANLADQAAARGGAPWGVIQDWPELDDGFVVHAPVDEYAANGFGLHNVHGNVWEWCLDGWDVSFYGQKIPRDPVSPHVASSSRVYRGGGFLNAARDARSAHRDLNTPANAGSYLGIRPARVITD